MKISELYHTREVSWIKKPIMCKFGLHYFFYFGGNDNPQSRFCPRCGKREEIKRGEG